jgi:peroxiredoxin Q/BCP
MPKLKPGDKAPDFALRDQRGKTVRLKDFRGKNVVVYFYPKADTPGCTTQACSLRDAEPDLKKLKAKVLGISPDTPEKQKKFDEKYGLGFPLLADEDHKVAQAWGTWGKKAFVVDAKGKVADAFYKVSPKATVPKTAEALEEMS